MKKIVVPYDYSAGSENALNFAVELAKKYISEIVLLHCFIPVYTDPTIPGGTISSIEMANLDELEESLNKKAREVQEKGVKTISRVLISDVANGINELVDSLEVDFVVLGKTGKSGFIDKFLGSTAENILNRVKVPILTIPEEYTKTRIYQLIYATQLEYDENYILDQVFEMGEKLKAKLELLKVNNSNQLDINPNEEFVNNIKSKFLGKNYEFITIDGTKSSKSIEEYSNSQENAVLILSSHFRGLLDGIFNPSISKKIISETQIPTLVFHFNE